MSNQELDKLYDMIDDLGTAMMVTEDEGKIRSRPMKGKIFRDSGEIWFLTESTSGKVSEIHRDKNSNLSYACPEKDTYISISGKAMLSKDKDKIDDLWGPWASIWFGCEKDDPKVAAICFKPEVAEQWTSESSKTVQIWEMAKAYLTNEKPDVGEHKIVNM